MQRLLPGLLRDGDRRAGGTRGGEEGDHEEPGPHAGDGGEEEEAGKEGGEEAQGEEGQEGTALAATA